MLVGGLQENVCFGVICVFADYFILDSFLKQIIYFFQSALNIFYKKKKKKKKKIQRSGRDKIYNPTRASNPKINNPQKGGKKVKT